MANKTKDYYPQEKGVIRRDRAGEFRDIMARELMFEALGLIPFAGMAGKFGKAMRPVSEYTSQFKPVGKQSISRESAKFKKDLLSGKVDSYGKPQTDVGRSHHAKYGPHYTDAGIESRMGTPGIAASSHGGEMNLKDWTPVAVANLKAEIKKNDKIYDEFVKGFKNILSAKHDLGESTLKGKFTKLFKPLRDKEKLAQAKYRLRESGVRRGDLKNKAVQEHFLNPAAKQARSELAKQFPKVPK
jgi:hypothetical protein